MPRPAERRGRLARGAALGLGLAGLASCAPPCGAGATIEDGACVGEARMRVRVPLPAGTSYRIGQGMHGPLSHQGRDAFAIDFAVPEGTPVSAARAGVVIATRGDSTIGCGTLDCAGDANFVVVDHGDATFGRYWHLAPGGVDVAVGDVVCAGTPLGRSGQTGYALGPHLHFDVVDPLGTTRPLFFEGLPGADDGWLWEGAERVSESPAPTACAATETSTCPSDLFGFVGVPLVVGAPCGLAVRDEETSVEGLAPGARRVALRRYADVRASWIDECADVAPDGTFRLPLRFPRADHGPVTRYLVVRATDEGPCAAAVGSDVSVTLHLR